jgi:hypothetical protein
MATQQRPQSRATGQRPWPWQVPAALLVAALLALGLLLCFAERWVRWGLVGHIWYVVVLILGVFVAWFSFTLADSYASYTGKVWGGRLRVGGPAVVVLVVCVLGFVLAPKPVEKFDVTVFLQAPSNAPKALEDVETDVRLRLLLGADVREERLGAKGEVRFVGVPADLLDQAADLRLIGSLRYGLGVYDPPGTTAAAQPLQVVRVKLGQAPIQLELRPQVAVVHGRVIDASGRPVPQAHWRLLGGGDGHSAADGAFLVQLLAHASESDRELSVQAPGYAMWRGTVVPNGGVLTVQLRKSDKP